MNKLLLCILFFSSVFAHAQEKIRILDCMETVFINDPNFEQGSEKYFDIFVVNEKLEVSLTTGDMRREIILPVETNAKAYVDMNEGSLSSSWNGKTKVDLVLRDFGSRWRGVFMFSEGYQSETLKVAPGQEIELSCVLKL